MNNKHGSNSLSSAELALLGLTAEKGPVSGYELDRLIERRGFRDWAGLGRTSIYGALKKLARRGLISLTRPKANRGRGPAPNLAELTDRGRTALVGELTQALAGAGRDTARFDLALAFLPALDRPTIIGGLKERRTDLAATLGQVGTKFIDQGGEGLPLHVRALFEHGLARLETEVALVDRLLAGLDEEKGGIDGQARS